MNFNYYNDKILICIGSICFLLLVGVAVNLEGNSARSLKDTVVDIIKGLKHGCDDVKPKLSSVPLPRVALVSCPGSGSPLVRSLLQRVTGIATGSIYCTKDRDVWPGECLQNRSVLTVNTHSPWITEGLYDKAVILLRNPIDTIIEEYGDTFEHSHQKMSYLRLRYSKYDSFRTFLLRMSLRWTLTYSSWLEFPGPILVIFYEEVIRNPEEVIRRILDFINIKGLRYNMHCLHQRYSTSSLHFNNVVNIDKYLTGAFRKILNKNVIDILTRYEELPYIQKLHNQYRNKK